MYYNKESLHQVVKKTIMTQTSLRPLWCNTAGRGLIGQQLATAWVKVLSLCFTDD